jgi:hypothetical protein
MSRPSREAVMTALFNVLAGALKTTFTADLQVNSVTLSNPSGVAALFVGLPVFGTGIPRGAIIQTLSPLTLSLPATVNSRAVTLTTGFLTTGRRLKFAKDVTAQPALFLRGADEEIEYPSSVLQVQTIKAEVWIYSKAGEDPDVAPETGLNNLLDAVQAAFAPDDPMQQRFTLGGLVHWVRIVGRIEKSNGDLDGQAVAIADVEITVP